MPTAALPPADAMSHADMFRELADNVPALIASYDAHSLRCLFANAPYARLFGRDARGIVGQPLADIIGAETQAQVQAHIDGVLRGEAVVYERQRLDADGRPVCLEVHLVPHRGPGGEVAAFFVLISDITRHRHADRTLRETEDRLGKFIDQLSHRDTLTELPNRAAFMGRIEQLMAHARAAGEELALLFIDLDHFKRVNDSLGHQVGDALLQTIAQRIGAVLRATDVVARFGGDEFMVLVGGRPRREDVADVARKLLAAIEAPLQAEAGRLISVTPSIGIAMFPVDGTTPAVLIRHADTAMYRAKARGRATYQFFEPSLAAEAYAALVLEGELAHALERGEFVLHYQPQVRASDGALVGAEALIRWQHPERGLLLPEHFIALAEQQRLMLPIGQWVLREAAATARRWHDSGLCEVPVAVNLSARQFQDAHFVASVHSALEDAQLPGRLLELELTERMLMDELPAVSPKLAQLKALGIRLSVDDFGTGYSSLGQLKSLPIDKMKIDRSFVSDLPGARDSVAIARAVIQMAKSLDLAVIAEGVETLAQRDFLAAEQCDELQGIAISAPLAADDFGRWVGARQREAQRC